LQQNTDKKQPDRQHLIYHNYDLLLLLLLLAYKPFRTILKRTTITKRKNALKKANSYERNTPSSKETKS